MLHLETVLVEKMIFQSGVKVREATGDGARRDADMGRALAGFRQIRIGKDGRIICAEENRREQPDRDQCPR